ncbi:MAG TPA: GNAT family N-acetyltransferase [Patescibacteria group bacterium]|nr:GNAT family N-acetyltransferase [Patescibacteria group bacterium]
MEKKAGHEDLHLVQFVDLTEDRMEAVLQLFRDGGWDAGSLFSVRHEMRACVRGDIPGYIRPHFILAVVKDQVIGAAAWAASPCSFNMYELSWATVAPAWRHQGINALMLQKRLEQVRELHGPGPLDVLVCTWVNAMYARTGFVPLLPPGEFHDEKSTERILLKAHFEK